MRLQRIAPTIALRCSAILPGWLPCKIFFTTEDFPTQAFPKVLLTKWRNNKPRLCEEERRINLLRNFHLKHAPDGGKYHGNLQQTARHRSLQHQRHAGQ